MKVTSTGKLAFDVVALVDQIQKQLPRLLCATLDNFPLAGGRGVPGERGYIASDLIPVLAVRSVPAGERLDKCIAQNLRAVVAGDRPVQLEARQLILSVPATDPRGGSDSFVNITVAWHDVVDFISLLLKGNPSCVEAVETTESLIFSCPEWASLRDILSPEDTNLLRCGKSYRMACVGPLMSLFRGKPLKKMTDAFEAEAMEVVAALSRRAACGGPESLRARVLELEAHVELQRREWGDLVSDLMTVALQAPDATQALPVKDLESWADSLRDDDFLSFANICATTPIAIEATVPQKNASALTSATLDPEWIMRLGSTWPSGAEVVFLAQTGSFMYDLHTEVSDKDYSIIFQADARMMLHRKPPSTEFQHHINIGFGANKFGELEYSGRELGQFLVELAKGNPRNIELLFTEKPYESNETWLELRAMRRMFLTTRCAKQYLGFISERLHRIADECETAIVCGFDATVGRKISKLLYHAHHKIFELTRILRGDVPQVALTGDEKSFIMQLRSKPPNSIDSARSLLANAEQQRLTLSANLNDESKGVLPAEVDAERLIAWLARTRSRQIAAHSRTSCSVASMTGRDIQKAPELHRSKSYTSDYEAIVGLLEEVETSEKVRIVHASYGPSSRTFGTTHEGSDHDVKCIFVLRRSEYFGLRAPPKTFKRVFAGWGGISDVEISGWEVRHACRMLSESNPTIMFMLHSPTAFKSTHWAEKLKSTAMEGLKFKKLCLAWRQHARQNFKAYIEGRECLLRKKYVHVLHPLLSLAWMRRQREAGKPTEWPPSQISDLTTDLAALGALSESEGCLLEELVSSTTEMPRALPGMPALDALVQRLLQDESSEAAEFSPAARRPSDQSTGTVTARESALEDEVEWHQLCASIVEDMSNFV